MDTPQDSTVNTAPDLPIVVGVDGSTDSSRALRFAIVEAERADSELWLVNAVHEAIPFAPMWPALTSETLTDAGHDLLDDARSLVEQVSDGRVKSRQMTALGPAVQILGSAAEQAQLVVLGHRSAGVVERLFTGSTTFGVVARAACPVVSVPSSWEADRRYDRLVAAVDGSPMSRAILARAFAAAQDRSAQLEVVHCWRLSPFYTNLLDEWSVRQEWTRQTSGLIQELVDEWSSRYPDVVVTTRMEYAEVADALVACSEHADVMYVGRHGHGGLGTRVAMTSPGSITRALLQHAHCPLEVIPVGSPTPTGAWEPER